MWWTRAFSFAAIFTSRCRFDTGYSHKPPMIVPDPGGCCADNVRVRRCNVTILRRENRACKPVELRIVICHLANVPDVPTRAVST